MTLFEFFFLLASVIGLVMLGYHMHLEAKATKHVSDQLDTILDILDEMGTK
jgi:hypothetical protein